MFVTSSHTIHKYIQNDRRNLQLLFIKEIKIGTFNKLQENFNFHAE